MRSNQNKKIKLFRKNKNNIKHRKRNKEKLKIQSNN